MKNSVSARMMREAWALFLGPDNWENGEYFLSFDNCLLSVNIRRRNNKAKLEQIKQGAPDFRKNLLEQFLTLSRHGKVRVGFYKADGSYTQRWFTRKPEIMELRILGTGRSTPSGNTCAIDTEINEFRSFKNENLMEVGEFKAI